MRCGVDRQLPLGHVVYHGDMHALYLRQCHQQQHMLAETAKRQATTGAIKNENANEKERNSTTAMSYAGSINAKTQKYAIPTSFRIIISK